MCFQAFPHDLSALVWQTGAWKKGWEFREHAANAQRSGSMLRHPFSKRHDCKIVRVKHPKTAKG